MINQHTVSGVMKSHKPDMSHGWNPYINDNNKPCQSYTDLVADKELHAWALRNMKNVVYAVRSATSERSANNYLWLLKFEKSHQEVTIEEKRKTKNARNQTRAFKGVVTRTKNRVGAGGLPLLFTKFSKLKKSHGTPTSKI